MKISGLALGAIAMSPYDWGKGTESEGHPESPNPLIHAVKLPSLEYHDPCFNAGDATMTPEIFSAQLDWIKKAKYHTPTSLETLKFLKGEALLPIHSVALRFDLGVDKVDENGKSIWLGVLDSLKERNLHAMVFVIPDAIGKVENGLTWKDLADYQKAGTISVCSHGLEDHPDYRHIHEDYAITSLKESKEKIIKGLSENGITNPQVLAFAFPYDSIPENASELIKKGGYSFFAGGVRKNGMNASSYNALGGGLPAIYPYVYREDIEIIKENANNFLPLLTIKGGLSFVNTLISNENQIPLDESWSGHELQLGDSLNLLPEEEILTGNLTNPALIVIHTDSQKEEMYETWNTQNTYNGLNGSRRKIAVNFGVDAKGTAQFTQIFRRENKLWIPIPQKEHEGASGIGSAINIEMSGIGYESVFENGENPGKKKVVLETIENTAELVANIINLSNGNLKLEDVVGHLDVSVKGKSDPGEKTMQLLRSIIERKLITK